LIKTGVINSNKRWILQYRCFSFIWLSLFLFVFSPLSLAQAASSQRKIVAAVLQDFPPLYSLDDAGKPIGFAIDILEHVATEADIHITYRTMKNWEQAMEAVRSGQADLIPGIGISKARRDEFLFSKKIETIPVSCFVRSSNFTIKGIDSLPGHRVSVLAHSVAESKLRAHMPGLTLISHDTVNSALFHLMAGDEDALVFPEALLKANIRQLGIDTKIIKMVGKPLMELKRGFLLRRTDSELLQLLDPFITRYTQSANYMESYQKWYGKPLSFWTKKRIVWTMGGLFLASMVGMCIMRNTSLNRYNRRLKKSEAELAALYQNAPLVMLLVDSQRRILKLNNLAREMTRQPDGETIGHLGGDALHCIHSTNDPEGCGFGEACEMCGIRNSIQETLETGKNISRREAKFVYQLPDSQQEMNLLVSTTFLEVNSEPLVLVCLEDITEQKMLEQQLRTSHKMEAIGTLAGGIAHDFNNILSTILGYGEMAKEQIEEGTPLHEDINEIIRAGHRAADLVQQILAFSRQDEQELVPLQIQFILKETVKMLQATLPTTIAIKVNIDTTCPPVMADVTQIQQIILNLCTNAKHAMLDKGGELTLTLQTQTLPHPDFPLAKEAKGPYLLLMVHDTGFGMDEQTMGKIFDPFFTTKKIGEGTGLGLAVVHGIVEGHQGFLLVESTSGKGTTFRIFLPLAEDASATFQAKVVQPLEKVAVGSKNLMVVDDEPLIAKVVSRMLRKQGYHVKSFTESSAALSHWQKNPKLYDLLISDVTMPGMSGVELSEKILEQRADLPIILLTGYSETINKGQAEEIGIRHFFMKPINPDELLLAIREVLDNG